MATLTAISFTMVGGLVCFGATIMAFGAAVKRQSPFVAARCIARPRCVIYNPNPTHPCQDRGNPTFGWIMWVMKLTYDTMLRGVPGTGTRDGGLTGALLKVNLDGIVLLRFHHMCLRVCFLAVILYLVVVLPLYKTAQCSRIGMNDQTEEDLLECQLSNLTDYQRLTLANIPTLEGPETDRFADIFYSFFLPVHDGLLARLYAVVFCAWIVTWYALRELQFEWSEVLAMRRVYYLEADHWSDRNEELQETLMREEREKTKRQQKAFHPSTSMKEGTNDDMYMKNRDPWIPHPEQRDTVPNVELYSILVGGLPSLPTEVFNQEEADAVFSRKQSIDWQLTVTTAFFDHCVPNQPGFSSSVAAVTILPGADQLTEAWNHWYRAASKLRRLRFIRKEISERRRYQIDEEAYPEDADPETGDSPFSMRRTVKHMNGGGPLEPTVYTNSVQKQQYFQEVLGSNTDLNVENNLLHALDFGPEQTAVYSREFAMGAANLAPNGCFEGKIRRAGIDELLEMEKKAVQDVHEANQDLKRAQGRIAESSEHDGDAMSDDDLERLMKTASKASSHGSFVGLEESESEPSHTIALKGGDDSQKGGDGSNYLLNGGGTSTTDVSSGPKRNMSDGALSSRSSFLSNTTSGHSTSEEFQDSFAQFSADDLNALERKDSFESELRTSSRDGDIEEGVIGEAGVRSRTPTPPTSKRFSLESLASTGKQMSFRNLRGSTAARDGETPSRFSLSSAGKQMSFLNPMPIVSNIMPQKSSSSNAERPPRRVKRASITSTQLPSDLGLEAGLFMEQKNLSLGGSSQHVSRSNTRQRRRMSNDSMDSFEDLPPRRRRPPRRTRSDDGRPVEEYGSQSPLREARVRRKPRRTKSSDDIDLFDDELEASARSNDGPSLKEMQASLREKPVSAAAGPSGGNNNKSDDKDGGESLPSQASGESIWDKLERDKERRSKLRERLGSLQSIQKTQSTDSSDSEFKGGPRTDLPASRASRTDNLKRDGAPHRPSRQPSAETGGRTSAGTDKDARPVSHHSTSLGEDREKDSDSDHRPNTSKKALRNGLQLSAQSTQSFHSFDGSNIMSAINENDTGSELSLGLDGLPGAALSPRQLQQHDSKRSLSSHTMLDDNLRVAMNFEEKAGLRERTGTNDQGPRRRLNTTTTDKWSKVVSIIKESDNNGERSKGRKIASGKWKILTLKQIFWKIQRRVMKILGRSTDLLRPDVVIDEFGKHSSYAVVTFTSRQAAVAARHCLADSRGADRWVTVGEIPSPPLADAPVCNMSSFRGCVRPVTLSISDKQKLLRKNIAFAALATIYFFYTIPLIAAQQLVSPENLSRLIPDVLEWQENSLFVATLFTGFIPALVWTGFFAICPPMFKIISNFGSNATSSVIAENTALHYFWWFMVVSAFTGASMSTAVINGFNEGIRIGAEIQQVIESTAAAIPTQVSATWLNWLIVRVTLVLPTQYLLQLNTFVFSFFGLTCCARTVRGGGSGGPVPYRIYVDSGVVMLCVFALAPASPLIAPAAFVYFLFCTPMLRWTMIFLYKPKFDIGGQRFPFMFDICISGMIVGQVLLVAMMTLKRAIGPAIVAFCPMIPTLIYRWVLRRRYLRAFNDAALLQTSLLDGWDTNEETCEAKREEFRRFLVDCHKAAYVPVCIASGDMGTSITAEPAVVVPTEVDEDFTESGSHAGDFSESMHDAESRISSLPSSKHSQQTGGLTRRPSVSQPGQMLRRTSAVIKHMHVGDDTSTSERGHDILAPEQAPGGLTRKYSYSADVPLPPIPSHYAGFGSPKMAGRRRVLATELKRHVLAAELKRHFAPPLDGDSASHSSPRKTVKTDSRGMPRSLF